MKSTLMSKNINSDDEEAMFAFTANEKEGDPQDSDQSNYPKYRQRSVASDIGSDDDYDTA